MSAESAKNRLYVTVAKIRNGFNPRLSPKEEATRTMIDRFKHD